MKIGFFLAAGLLVTATGAIAAAPGADDTAERAATAVAEQTSTGAAEAEPQEEKKVCRTERATGSLTRRTRVCLTAAQWREVHDKTRRGVGEMQGSAAGSQAIVNNPGAGGQ